MVNTLSHLLGALLGIAATAVLVTLAAREQKWVHLVGFAVYGTSLMLALLASGLLHGVLAAGRYSRVLGILDHCYISLGWLAIVFMVPIYRNLGGAIAVILVAGLLYTGGAISFQRGRPNPFPPYFGNHELWHVAVLLGNGLFCYVMLVYVLPYP